MATIGPKARKATETLRACVKIKELIRASEFNEKGDLGDKVNFYDL